MVVAKWCNELGVGQLKRVLDEKSDDEPAKPEKVMSAVEHQCRPRSPREALKTSLHIRGLTCGEGSGLQGGCR